jgi:hypothetical protein
MHRCDLRQPRTSGSLTTVPSRSITIFHRSPYRALHRRCTDHHTPLGSITSGMWFLSSSRPGLAGVLRQITKGAIRAVAPNTTNPITNATIVKPITWRTLSFAIASRGSNQNGWIMFATPSPTATAIEINPR